MSDRAYQCEQAFIAQARQGFMECTLRYVVDYITTPTPCACTGGFRPAPAPCHCRMVDIAARQALAMCGLRVRSEDAPHGEPLHTHARSG